MAFWGRDFLGNRQDRYEVVYSAYTLQPPHVSSLFLGLPVSPYIFFNLKTPFYSRGYRSGSATATKGAM